MINSTNQLSSNLGYEPIQVHVDSNSDREQINLYP